MPWLARRNAAANPRRSLLVVGLLASATFVIVAVAANSRDLSTLDPTQKDSGTGGFSLVATCAVPLTYGPGTAKGREELGFSAEDEAALAGCEVISLLASPGEDISCLNLSRPTRPRVLGVPEALILRGGFGVPRLKTGENLWTFLRAAPDKDGAIPAFGDAASVQWSLHSGLGKVHPADAAAGEPRFRFVGLLKGSIFQRELLVSDANLRRLHPAVSAPSYFLIAVPPGQEARAAEALRRNLGELGLQVRPTREVLAEFMQVQNTYLSMFLALGGLGLLLGTVGVAAVLLRAVFERRRELSLLLALGFSRGRVAALLLWENLGLLVLGVGLGTLTALLAVAPQLASAQADVNWGALLSVLGIVIAVGVGTCLAAVRGGLRGDLVEELRRE